MVEKKKINLPVFFIILVLLSFVLMVFGKLDYLYFWIIMALVAIYAFKILPRKS